MAEVNMKEQYAREGERFLRAFATFIRVDIACNQFSEAEPHRFLYFLGDNLERWTASMETDYDFDLLFWPTLLTFSQAESELSKSAEQDRGTYLIGVRDIGIGRGHLEVEIATLLQDIRTAPQYLDEVVPPQISAVHVTREKLGFLTVDYTIIPLPENEFPPSASPPGTDCDFSELEPGTVGEKELKEESQAEPSKKLRPASDIINRLRWDPTYKSEDFAVIYLDRFCGYQEVPLDHWRGDSTDDDFIPQHRITAFRHKATGQIVWHREKRLDLVFGTG